MVTHMSGKRGNVSSRRFSETKFEWQRPGLLEIDEQEKERFMMSQATSRESSGGTMMTSRVVGVAAIMSATRATLVPRERCTACGSGARLARDALKGSLLRTPMAKQRRSGSCFLRHRGDLIWPPF